MKNIINWGVLGACSNISDMAILPAINAASNAKLYAISEEFAKHKIKAFEDKYNPVKSYDSFEDLLNDPQVDAVHVDLPNSMHYEWVLKAAKKGKHVLCEKPLGCTTKQVETMFQVCKENGVYLMEAFAYRQSQVIKKAKELADSGIVGKIKLVECYFVYPMSDLRNVRLIKKLGGGVIYDVGCYNFNFIRYITGKEPISSYSSGEISPLSQVDENVLTVLEFEDGLKGISHVAFNCGFRNEYRIIGDQGIIEAIDGFNAKGKLTITIKKDDDFFIRGRNYKNITVDCTDNYLLEVEQFGRVVLEGETPLITQSDSYYNAVLTDQVLDTVMKEKRQQF